MATLLAQLLCLGLVARVLKQIRPALLCVHAQKVAQVEAGFLFGVVLEARAFLLYKHFAALLGSYFLLRLLDRFCVLVVVMIHAARFAFDQGRAECTRRLSCVR